VTITSNPVKRGQQNVRDLHPMAENTSIPIVPQRGAGTHSRRRWRLGVPDLVQRSPASAVILLFARFALICRGRWGWLIGLESCPCGCSCDAPNRQTMRTPTPALSSNSQHPDCLARRCPVPAVFIAELNSAT